jgi:hypothetical protein
LILRAIRLDDAATFFNVSYDRPFTFSGISMTQILKGRFDGSRAANHTRAVSPEFLAERYSIDENGRRVLVGLTSAETHEFETLDSLSPSDGNCVAWTFGGVPTTSREKRWLLLYTKHDEAWKTSKTGNGRKPVTVG